MSNATGYCEVCGKQISFWTGGYRNGRYICNACERQEKKSNGHRNSIIEDVSEILFDTVTNIGDKVSNKLSEANQVTHRPNLSSNYDIPRENQGFSSYFDEGVYYFNTRDYLLALKSFNNSISYESSNRWETWYNKALVLTNMHKYREAIECYNKSLKYNNQVLKLAEFWVNKGIATFMLGESISPVNEEAVRYWMNGIDYISKGNEIKPGITRMIDPELQERIADVAEKMVY